MNYHQQEIQALNQELLNYQEVAPPEAIEAAEETRAEAEPDLSLLTERHAFEQHLNEFLTAARQRLEDGDREEPLCDCSRPTCPLKNEELPSQVLTADDLEAGIRRYERDHVGSAQVLADARDDFAETAGEVKTTLREAVGLIKQTDFSEDDDSENAEAAA